jgi:uncharacterized membrane protein YbhN (UPF0104 family)
MAGEPDEPAGGRSEQTGSDRGDGPSIGARVARPVSRGRRRVLVRGLLTVAIGAVAFAALLWVAPPHHVVRQLADMQLGWVIAAIAFEVASCVCYPIVFRRFFPEPPPGVCRQVAWISMGAGAVLPGGNISSAAATGWLMRNHGIGIGRLLARCGALLCLLTLFGFFVNGVAGVVLLLGISNGPHDLAHTGGPILVSVVVLGAAWLLMTLSRRLGPRAPAPLRALAIALEGAWSAVRSGHWRLLGAAGFLLLDMGALWAACHATGHPIGVPALIIAYCIGYLATIIPMPAGLGVLDSGLAASLVLYGMQPAASVGAVLVYHAISIWVPALGGIAAWLPTRGVRRREAAAERAADRTRVHVPDHVPPMLVDLPVGPIASDVEA